MELDHKNTDDLANHESVIFGTKVTQTCKAKWLCLENVYQKLHRANLYDIGGTYIEDVADYWFVYKTEQVHNIFLLHIFVCNRQENVFSVAISRNSEIKIDKKNAVVYLTEDVKEYRFKKSKEMALNYVTTYSFNNFEIDLLKERKLCIAVSFHFQDTRGLNQSVYDQVKLKHDFSALMNDPVGSDFIMESADGVKFHVHKILVGAHSDVFKAMFKAETAESQNGYVKLVDVDEDDLQCILECIYTGTIKDLENCNCLNMLMLADRYNIQTLKEIAQYDLCQQLCIRNALDLLMVADMYNSDELKNSALKVIKKNPSIIHTNTFKKIKNVELVKELCEYLIPT